jgi:hypothetical protein
MEVTPATFSISVTRVKDTIFIPLPKALWRKANGCGCDICRKDKTGGYWDTLAVGAKPENYERTWTVHHPGLHSELDRKSMAYASEG